jgi:hypothetical protein
MTAPKLTVVVYCPVGDMTHIISFSNLDIACFLVKNCAHVTPLGFEMPTAHINYGLTQLSRDCLSERYSLDVFS